MEFEQIIKRLEWLDDERRKDKEKINEMENRLTAIEGSLSHISQQLREIKGDIIKVSTLPARVDQFENALSRQRTEISHYIADEGKKREEQLEKRLQTEINRVDKTMAGLRKSADTITELKRGLQARTDEGTRIAQVIIELEKKVEEATNASDEVKRMHRQYEENRKQDTKRLTDMQGDLTAARKRIEELREKSDLLTDDLRRISNRLTELLSSETERHQSQAVFIEEQARLKDERDQAWKEWKDKFDKLGRHADSYDAQIREWEVAKNAVKRAQETYEGLIQKVERRLKEITEMQRLSEDRFRQEWVSFKADDQKRWTGYALSQDEQHRDNRTNLEKMTQRVTALEDLTQTQQDILQQTKEANQELLQSLLAQVHELLSAYERIMGSSR